MARKALRLGVVGCGAVFERHHLQSLRRSRDWRLVSASDLLSDRREWVRRAVGVDLIIVKSLAELLAASEPDAILIATPPDSHAALTLQALQAERHVLVEKPMALIVTDARAMLEASRQARRHLWVGFSRRFLQGYLDLRRTLRGIPRERIRSIRSIFFADADHWRAASAYLGDTARGGGVLDDVLSHQLDLLSWLIDLEIREIRTEAVDAPNGARRVVCDARFENGLLAHCDAGHTDTYTEAVEVELDDRTLVAQSRHRVSEVPRGRRVQPSAAHGLGVWQRGWRALRRRPSPIAESFDRQLAAFAAVIRGRDPRLTGADALSGLRAVEAVQACRQSLKISSHWTPVIRDGAAL